MPPLEVDHANLDEFCKISGAADYCKVASMCLSVHCIKGIYVVDEYSLEIHILFDAFLLNLSYCKDHVDGDTSWSEAALNFL